MTTCAAGSAHASVESTVRAVSAQLDSTGTPLLIAPTPGRALEVFSGVAYAIIGEEFLELQGGGVRVLRGVVRCQTSGPSRCGTCKV